MNFTAEEFVVEPQDSKRAVKAQKTKRHDEQRGEHVGVDAGAGEARQAGEAGRLVQRVPPFNREFYNWQIDRADEREPVCSRSRAQSPGRANAGR